MIGDFASDAFQEWSRDAVPLGPFDAPPLDLYDITFKRPNGERRDGPKEIFRAGREWLLGALESADVEVGTFDHLIAGELARDWPTVQAVAGWIARANRADSQPRDAPVNNHPVSPPDEIDPQQP